MWHYLDDLPFFIKNAVIFLIVSVVYKIYLLASSGVCKSENKLHGKTAIITGANSGIGKETAIDLAHRGARIILACRDVKKATDSRDGIINKTGNKNVVVRQLDLASFKSVRDFAAEILKTEPRLDILINNAGCAGMEKRLTEDGLDIQMQTNHFGHFLLTNLLLGLLKKSAPSRIINVSSVGHSFTTSLDFTNLNSEISHDPSRSYFYSKLSQILFTRYLAPLIIDSGVTINSLHPGVVQSDIFRHFPLWLRFFTDFACRPLFKTAKEGAQTSIYLAVADEVSNVTGEYFTDCKISKASKLALDDGNAKKMWEVSESLVHLKPEDRNF